MNTQDTCNPVKKQIETTLKVVLIATIQSLSIVGKLKEKQILRILEDMCERMHLKVRVAYLEFLIEEALETDLEQYFEVGEYQDFSEECRDEYTEAESPEAESPEAESPEAESPEAESPEAESPEDSRNLFDYPKYVKDISSFENCQAVFESKIDLSTLPSKYCRKSMLNLNQVSEEIALHLTWDQLILRVADYLKVSNCLQKSGFVVDDDSFIFQWVKEQLDSTRFIADDAIVIQLLDDACLLNEETTKGVVGLEDHPEDVNDGQTSFYSSNVKPSNSEILVPNIDPSPQTSPQIIANQLTLTDVIEFLEFSIVTGDSATFKESLDCLLTLPELPNDFQELLDTFYSKHSKYLLVFTKSLLLAKVASSQLVEILSNTVSELGFKQGITPLCDLCALYIIHKFIMEG